MIPILSIEEQNCVYHALSLLESKCEKHEFTSPDLAKNFFRLKLRARSQEVFATAYLDNKNMLIEYCEMFFGGIESATVCPRLVLRQALILNASSMILAHNHPSGVVAPSSADKQITKKIKEACDLMDIRLLDHIIVGEGAYSFAEYGEL